MKHALFAASLLLCALGIGYNAREAQLQREDFAALARECRNLKETAANAIKVADDISLLQDQLDKVQEGAARAEVRVKALADSLSKSLEYLSVVLAERKIYWHPELVK